ncbi:MAG: hypothetical protein V4764_12130 [Burkholderia sp.]
MKRPIIALSALTLLSALGACTRPVWVQAGMNPDDATVALADCSNRALHDLPPQYASTEASSSMRCSRHDGQRSEHRDCDRDTEQSIVDLNKRNRSLLIDACMIRRGWHKAQVKTRLGKWVS